jgi:hypothetical protein
MSKAVARGPQSYQNEQLLLDMLPGALEALGFLEIRIFREAGMKFADATREGRRVRFWVKQGWTDARSFCAIQFGLFDQKGARDFPNEYFIDHVADRVASAKARGATHALLVHILDRKIVNFVALEISDVTTAYRRQIKKWPKRARNTKTPSLWFEDSRDSVDAKCVTAVTDLEIDVTKINGSRRPVEKARVPASKKITAEVELRTQQHVFRARVGDRYGWRCAVTGTTVVSVLDAAHLPGRDWRKDNTAQDGVLVRSDIHRLMDRGLAAIRNGFLHIKKEARIGEYEKYHRAAMLPPE